MELAVELRELSSLFSVGPPEEAAERAVLLLRSLPPSSKDSCHARLCAAMLRSSQAGWGGRCHELLHHRGPGSALTAASDNLPHAMLPVARWLSGEVLGVCEEGLAPLLCSQCAECDQTVLMPQQERLVDVVCRLPDQLANRLERQLQPDLLPRPYFRRVGLAILACLCDVCKALKGSRDCSLLFVASLLAKCVMLGHKDVVLRELVPKLEEGCRGDPLWRRVSQALFSRLPPAAQEPVIETLVQLCTPSLAPPTPLYHLLGGLVSVSQRAKFLLTHKLVLVRVPSSSSSREFAAHNMFGYLLSVEEGGGELVGTTLLSALGVWSDSSALRHMDERQHLWISQVIVLAAACLSEEDITPLKTKLQSVAMQGVQAHIDSPLQEWRHIGMAVGECLMNRLNPTAKHKLSFDYQPSSSVAALRKLSRPLDEQERELRAAGQRPPNTTQRKEEEEVTTHTANSNGAELFGTGFVRTATAESDSDDDLVPYTMDDDPDTSKVKPPRYLRTLLQALLSTKEPAQQEAALCVAESLIRSRPPDLIEVCTELARVLLHLSDSFALADFVPQRHRALVALVTSCPSPVAQLLTGEFYAPNYNIRQRLDILEVLSAAALELSQPESLPPPPPPRQAATGRSRRKPWEAIIEERLKTKTRVISKSRSRPEAQASRFAPVAPLFFFPLMSCFDRPVNTLDLLGQDVLVLGELLHTLGTVIHCASHAPIQPAMATALIDFVWGFRYHSNGYVRQAVLFAVGMLLSATPSHFLAEVLGSTLAETSLWIKDAYVNDSDEQCRTLARHCLSLLQTLAGEVAPNLLQ